MYLLIKIRHTVVSLYNVIGIMFRWKSFNYMLGIDISRNYLPKDLGFMKGDF